MKNIFVYIDYLDNLGINFIQKELNEGNIVYAMICDRSLGICKANYCASTCICNLCNRVIFDKFKELNNTNNLHVLHLEDFMTEDVKKASKEVNLYFYDVASLKAVTYKGIEIGYAAFSSYVSITRNIKPSFNKFFCNMIYDMLLSQVRVIMIMEKLMKEIRFDLFIVHNGRHSNLKPFYRMAEINGIDFILTERQWTKDGDDLENCFLNTTPHSAKGIYDQMCERWEKGGEDKFQIAESFFTNRRFGKFSGDQNYIKNQVQDQLPEGFDPTKRNISIFNSSEDEYYSINREFDESGLYPNQYSALYALFERFKDDDDIHFYLRIHPNLGEVPYESHMKLYNLKYKNVTIIPPYSPISSYALMEASEKVITFISTMTIESSYWEKPVIALNRFYYSYMDLANEPRTEEEFFNMVVDKNLPIKKNENCLKVSYYYMAANASPLKHFPTRKKRYTYGPVIVETYSQFKLLGSYKILAFLQKLLRMAGHAGIIGKYDHVPQKTK